MITARCKNIRTRAAQRGQSMLIFALCAIVIFATIGLAVDGSVSYLASTAAERAAASSALAGVPYMPNYSSASTYAQDAATRNNFANGADPTGRNVAVLPAAVYDSHGVLIRNRLKVTISENVQTTFLHLLGFGIHRITVSDTAEYLRPITLGQGGSQIGSDLSNLGTPGNYYIMRSEGWGVDRQEGDAYTPNPADPATSSFAGTDIHLLNSTPGKSTETADSSAPTWLAQRGGYNYQIYVPPGQTGVKVQVYNPVFAPDNGYNPTGGSYNMHEQDYDFTAACYTNPVCYSTMGYTLFTVPNTSSHASDLTISSMVVNPIDARGAPTSAKDVLHGFATINPMPSIYHNWVDVTDNTRGSLVTETNIRQSTYYPLSGGPVSGAGAYYRLRVDTLNDVGQDPGGNRASDQSRAHKGYAVRAVDSSGSLCGTCTVSALNDMALFTPVQAGTFNVPLFSLPPEYAGKNISVYVYDPGDLQKTGTPSNVLSILEPDLTTIPAPPSADGAIGVYDLGSSLVNCGPCTPAQGTYWPYQDKVQAIGPAPSYNNWFNAHWIRFDIGVPATYCSTGCSSPSSWYWYMQYSTNVTAVDTVSVTVTYFGSPVHLLP